MSMQALAAAIIYVGHSLTGPTLPLMLQDVLDRTSAGGQIEFQVIPGSPLHWNWSHSQSADRIDARAGLEEGDTDVLIITEGIPFLEPASKYSTTVEYAQRWNDLAAISQPGARTYIYETWHDLRSGTGVDVEHDSMDHISWRERLDLSLRDWEYVVDRVNARRPQGSEPMRLIPAGQAMAMMYDQISIGAVPGITTIEDLFVDTIHPNELGWYFITMVHYAAIYERDPKGLPYRLEDEWGGAFVAPSAPLAAKMQDIAWKVVGSYQRQD